MWRGLSIGLWTTVLGLTQCARPTSTSREPTTLTTPPATQQTQPDETPAAEIDPRRCIDPRSPDGEPFLRWRDQLDVRFDQLLATATCPVSDKSAGPQHLAFFISFDKQGAQKELSVRRSTAAACGVAECLKPVLSKLEAPEPPDDPTRYYVAVEVEPGSAPRRVSPQKQSTDEQRGPCVDRKEDTPKTEGHLPPELIQKVIRARFGEFRLCYEKGLARDPYLTGRVSVRFIIGKDGKVSEAYVSDNTLPDCEVARCVASTFPSFVFPAPASGKVTVVYPIMLAPE